WCPLLNTPPSTVEKITSVFRKYCLSVASNARIPSLESSDTTWIVFGQTDINISTSTVRGFLDQIPTTTVFKVEESDGGHGSIPNSPTGLHRTLIPLMISYLHTLPLDTIQELRLEVAFPQFYSDTIYSELENLLLRVKSARELQVDSISALLYVQDLQSRLFPTIILPSLRVVQIYIFNLWLFSTFSYVRDFLVHRRALGIPVDRFILSCPEIIYETTEALSLLDDLEGLTVEIRRYTAAHDYETIEYVVGESKVANDSEAANGRSCGRRILRLVDLLGFNRRNSS
ncbi:hypothetical protein CVT26_009785, partial [Gymnopilus dilepis]